MKLFYASLLLIFTSNAIFSQSFEKNKNGKYILFESSIPELEVIKESSIKLPHLYDLKKSKKYFEINIVGDENRKFIIEPSFTKNIFITDGAKNCKSCSIKFRGDDLDFDPRDYFINYSKPLYFAKEGDKGRKNKLRIIEPDFLLTSNKVIGIKNGNKIKYLGGSQLYDPVFGSKTSIVNFIADVLSETTFHPKIFKKGMGEIQASKFYISLQPVINSYFFNSYVEEYYVKEKPNPNASERNFASAELQIDWKLTNPDGSVLFEVPTRVLASFPENDPNELFKLVLQESIKSLFSTQDVLNKIKSSNAILESTNVRSLELKKSDYTTFSDIKSMISKSRESVVTIFNSADMSFGSGFLISSEGYIITNYHVIDNNKSIKIQFNGDTTKYNGTLLNVDEDIDLALIKVEGKKNISSLLLANSESVEVGENVYAIGTPGDKKLSQSVTKGIISGKREIDEKNYFQTDVSINFGNSGGPLINENGEVIGVVVMKIVGSGIEGLSFVIPSAEVIKMLGIVYK